MIEFLTVPGAPAPVAPFSHATAVDGWLFVTGQMPTDPEDDVAPLPEGIEAGSLSSGRRSRTRGTGAISPPGSPNGQANTPKLTGWVEENIEETLTFHRLPRQHHKHPKSTNMRERLNEEIKRRSHVVRIFPNGESCWRLVRALAIETHENWLEQHRCLNMDDRREHKEEALRRAA